MQGSFRLVRLFGIDVFVHWSWLLIAVFESQQAGQAFRWPGWGAIEYVSLFAIVLLHEFGHALACRSVGGQAQQIVLWPLGGVAKVQPPPRPAAFLWSIAAGPLVNVVLLPVLLGVLLLLHPEGPMNQWSDPQLLALHLVAIDVGLLVFNLLPIYPLDGGQILQSLLWFIIGRGRSLMVVSILGVVCGLGLLGLAVYVRHYWLGIMAGFAAWQSVNGVRTAQLLLALMRLPRHSDAACPSCKAAPFKGDFWTCNHCGRRFDTFATGALCPGCQQTFPLTMCPECHRRHAMSEWFAQAVPADQI